MEKLAKQYKQRAESERQAGGHITINKYMPYISITLSGGESYFFEDHEADDLLASVPDWINTEDYLLASAQEWG